MKTSPIILEQLFNAPLEKVWKAISTLEDMQQWYFNITEFELKLGFQFQFWAGDEHHQWLHLCQITEIVINKKLTYSWRYQEYKDITTWVSFDIFPEGSKTRLKLTHENVESFPQDHPAFSKESFIEGWTYIIGISLKKFLEK